MISFFRKYHYVPPCPRCGSLKTGRFCYVTNTAFGVEKLVADNLKNGELSKVELGFGDELEYNAYCEDCGIRWMAKIEELKLTEERIAKESANRGISREMYTNMRDFKKIKKKEKRKEKKEIKLAKKEAKRKQKATKKPKKKKNGNTPSIKLGNKNKPTYS